MGYSGFRADHLQAHALLDELKIPHDYRDGPRRSHNWHSGWVSEAVELLVEKPEPKSRRAKLGAAGLEKPIRVPAGAVPLSETVLG